MYESISLRGTLWHVVECSTEPLHFVK